MKNSGAVRGAEVVQLYISDETGAPIAGGRVPQVLRGFSKVWLDPGEERDVEFVLDGAGPGPTTTPPAAPGTPPPAVISSAWATPAGILGQVWG